MIEGIETAEGYLGFEWYDYIESVEQKFIIIINWFDK